MRKLTYLAVFEPTGPSENPLVDEETAPGYVVSYITTFPDIVSLEYDNKSVKTKLH